MTEGLLGLLVLGCRRGGLAAVHDVADAHACHEDECGDPHEAARPEKKQPVRDRGARGCASGAAHAKDVEEAFAPLARVDVRAERPELSDHHAVEDADPQVERDTERQLRASQDREHGQVRHEEEAHVRDELHAADAGGQPAVDQRDADQENGLPRSRELLQFGATAEKDERLAGHLEQVVGRQQEEHVEGQQERRGGLPLTHFCHS